MISRISQMNNHTLLLHIGLPKTGSTSLESYFTHHREFLNENGWDYPSLEELSEGQQGTDTRNGNAFYNENPYKYEYSVKKELSCVINRLRSGLKTHSIVLSSELIWMWNMEIIIAELCSCFKNVKVLIYLRRQDLEIEALYNQYVKGNLCFNGDIYEFLRQIYKTDAKKVLLPSVDLSETDQEFRAMYDYAGRIKMLEKYLGRQNIIVRVYERSQLKNGDVVADCIGMMGIEKALPKDEIPHINLRLEGGVFEVKRSCNSFFKKMNIAQYNRSIIARVFSTLSENSDPLQKYGFFSLAERRAIMDLFSEGNAYIAKEYFQRENGLFIEELKDLPVYECEKNANIKALADALSVFMLLTDHQLNLLKDSQLKERKHNYLLWASLLRIAQKEKLYLFGAGRNCLKALIYFREQGIKVDAIYDNYSDVEQIEGIPVKRPDDELPDGMVIITVNESLEIEKQLCDLGIKDYLLARELIYDE